MSKGPGASRSARGGKKGAPSSVGGERPALDIEQILRWADAHRTATGRWPDRNSGPVGGSGGETWGAIYAALSVGRRGLPGGSSLPRLLAERRGALHTRDLSPLTIEQILAWSDAHHEATGRRPRSDSGPVRSHPELSWNQVNRALARGLRGLPGGATLAGLLLERRGPRSRRRDVEQSPLDVEQILAWADAHRQATGEYPGADSGRVLAAPGETWRAVEAALAKGHRGLPGGSSLAQLLAERRRYRGPLTLGRILAWADAHHDATGRWPRWWSWRSLRRAPGETWASLDAALRDGRRGLPGGSSLARLLAEHREAPHIDTESRLTAEQILAWADAHRQATGRWPSSNAGSVLHAEGVTWGAIESALRGGYRGLPGGQSLGRLIREHAGQDAYRTRPALAVGQVLAWADAHRASTGAWPVESSGPVAAAPGENWRAIGGALRRGTRGLPGGSSLARLLAERRGAREPKVPPRLAVEQVLAWADAHRAATGRWPSVKTGPVDGEPGEKWVNLNMALRHGRRGLPGGTTLGRLIAEHRGGPAPAAAPARSQRRPQGGP